MKYAQANVDELAKDMGGKGGYAIYVGSLTVPLHNAWADSAIKYQKEKYPDMFEVTSRLPVAESIDKSYATTLDLMKTYPQMKGIIGFGSSPDRRRRRWPRNAPQNRGGGHRHAGAGRPT